MGCESHVPLNNIDIVSFIHTPHIEGAEETRLFWIQTESEAVMTAEQHNVVTAIGQVSKDHPRPSEEICRVPRWAGQVNLSSGCNIIVVQGQLSKTMGIGRLIVCRCDQSICYVLGCSCLFSRWVPDSQCLAHPLWILSPVTQATNIGLGSKARRRRVLSQ